MAKPVPHVSWFLLRKRTQRRAAPGAAARQSRDLWWLQKRSSVLAQSCATGGHPVSITHLPGERVTLDVGDASLSVSSVEYAALQNMASLSRKGST